MYIILKYFLADSLQLDKDASEDINSTIAPCSGGLKELRTHHDDSVVEIKQNTGKCLGHEYKVDEATSSTPRKRQYNIPTVGSIEELKTPSFEELLKAFHDSSSKSPKQMQHQPNGEAKHVSSNGRPPLTAINWFFLKKKNIRYVLFSSSVRFVTREKGVCIATPTISLSILIFLNSVLVFFFFFLLYVSIIMIEIEISSFDLFLVGSLRFISRRKLRIVISTHNEWIVFWREREL